MAVVLMAKFTEDVAQLTRAYDEAHRIIMERGGAPGELRHHCAISDDALGSPRSGAFQLATSGDFHMAIDTKESV